MSRLTFFTCLCLALCWSIFGHAQILDYDGKTVGDIEIVFHRLRPESTFDPGAVRARLKTKVGEPFSQLDFDEDLKTLAADYDRIEPSLDLKDGQVFVRLDLWPKPIIRSIIWKGREQISQRKLEKELGFSPGDIFERSAFATAFQKVKAYYVKKGFFEAELTYRVIPEPTRGEVDIEISVQEGRIGHIRSVRFKGFTRAEQLELMNMVATKKYSLCISWVTGQGAYQSDAVEHDRFVVLNYLHDKGYADARVDVEIVDVPELNGIVVEFVAEKGPEYSFGGVEFQGNTLFSSEELASHVTFKAGEVFSPERLRQSVKALTDLYGSKGYIEAVVNYEQHRVPGKAVFDVDFEISEGQQYRVGLVRIFGNQRTQQRVIMRESSVQPGELFDIRRLQNTEEILRNMGYFESVNVYCVRPHHAPLPDEQRNGPFFRDVYIEVCETSTGSLSLNFGGGTQDGAFTGLEFCEKNFNARGLPYVFRRGPRVLRGAGEFLRMKAEFGKKVITLYGSWTKPRVFDTCWALGFDVERSMNRRQSRDYRIDKIKFGAHATQLLNCYTLLAYRYRLSYENTELRKPANQLPAELVQAAQNNGTVSAIGTSLTYDSTNFCHTRGFRSIFEAEYAGLLGDFQFLKFNYLNAYYRTLPPFGTLRLRVELRLLQPIWDQSRLKIPMAERFFLGGESTIRGYAPYTVGPQQAHEPLGGLTSVFFSAELNRNFMRGVDGFIFFDGGFVSSEPWEVKTPRVSIGFGFRVNLMQQMPLTLGWGFPLNPKFKNDVENFYFSVSSSF